MTFLISAILALITGAAAQAPAKTAATVNGEVITEDQVIAAAAELERRDPAQARSKLEFLHKALDAIAEDKMIGFEAAKLQVSKQQIIYSEIDSNVSAPTDEQIAGYYEANKARFTVPREQALPQIRQLLTDRSRSVYRDALLRALKREYGFKSFLDPLRTEVATAGYPARGPATAPVTIVEFSDFECPFCGRLFPTLKAVENIYLNRVRIVYRQFPLRNIHPRAQKAAEASLCAGEQGRFWDMHDSLFGDQEHLTVDALKARAVALKLDAAAFNACLDSGKEVAAIDKDIAEGAKAGVTGTPTMFINGRMMVGNQPYGEIQAVIEDELKRKKN
jgi:predicted DsbA family dithiol-disulfide isomerase